MPYVYGHRKKDELNKYTYKEDLGYVGVTCTGGTFIIDLEDIQKVKNYLWYIDKSGYVLTSKLKKEKGKKIFLHRYIMNLSPDRKIQVDHINRIKTDNRKFNLRVCTPSQNSKNKEGLKNKFSTYKGVTKAAGYKTDKKFTSVINLGTFDDEKEAALAYDQLEYFLHGDFAFLNFPENLEDYKKLKFLNLVRK